MHRQLASGRGPDPPPPAWATGPGLCERLVDRLDPDTRGDLRHPVFSPAFSLPSDSSQEVVMGKMFDRLEPPGE